MKNIFVLLCFLFASTCYSEHYIDFQIPLELGISEPRFRNIAPLETDDGVYGGIGAHIEYLFVKDSGLSLGAKASVDYHDWGQDFTYNGKTWEGKFFEYGWSIAPALGWTFGRSGSTLFQLITYPVIFARSTAHCYDTFTLDNGQKIEPFSNVRGRVCWKTGCSASIQWGNGVARNGIVLGMNIIIADNYFSGRVHSDPSAEFSLGYKLSFGF